ncbi:hypothetical protein V7968_19165 [Nocardia vulneris]|uniref:hypothetical protein n=1 Tax=Nocardia vulneris TaxID=1141657 RepID=UPI0030CAA718
MSTFVHCPRAHHESNTPNPQPMVQSARRLTALRVASQPQPPEVLSMRGMRTITEVDGIVPER